VVLIELQSGDLRATITPIGAEVRSLSLRGVEYLWPAQELWKRTAPILFPIVGKLREDTLFDKGRLYTMGQHGFARDKSFRIEDVSTSAAKFNLTSDQSTLKQYPFKFVLEAAYELRPDRLLATYSISNPGAETLPASFGLHPAFRWPLDPAGDKTAYVLRFEKEEAPGIRRLKDGLLKPQVFASPIRDKVLPLSESLFKDDAVIFLGVNSSEVEYGGPAGPSVRLSWSRFTDLALWSRAPGDFLCIEPWHGYADPEGFKREFTRKPGLMLIEPGDSRDFTVVIEPRG
jgi:galactose mutarotase-like enzyme